MNDGQKKGERMRCAFDKYQAAHSGNRRRENDPRLTVYIETLQEGRVADCMKLREQYADDPSLLQRFDTMESQVGNLTMLYIREIQICRREIAGWRNLADGFEALADRVRGPKRNQAQGQIGKGLKQLESALTLRKQGEVINVPSQLNGETK